MRETTPPSAQPATIRYNRYPLLVAGLGALLFILSVPIIRLSESFSALVAGRLLQGISGGLIGVVVPLYLAECIGAGSRGKGTGMFPFLLKMRLPKRLVEVQKLMIKNDKRAANIHETIGVYLDHSALHGVPRIRPHAWARPRHHRQGRRNRHQKGTTSPQQGVSRATLTPPKKIAIHVPDEKSRRVGQAVAAASPPEIKKSKA